MIEPGREMLSLRRQAALLRMSRNRLTLRAHPARAAREQDQKALRDFKLVATAAAVLRAVQAAGGGAPG
jgi:hypothetical protein